MKRSITLLIALFFLGLAGCDRAANYADLQGFMDKAKAQSSSSVEAIAEGQLYKAFTYDAAALRNPFQATTLLDISPPSNINISVVQPDPARIKHVLEDFPIESLVVVGMLSNSRNNYALLRSSNGVHRVAVGDYVGVNHGRISTITASRIEVVEIIADAEGGRLEQSHTLVLQER